MTAIATDLNVDRRAAVFCVGGAGANIAAVLMDRLVDADVIEVNTEAGSVRATEADMHIHLRGDAASGDYEAARRIALENEASIRHLIRNYQYVHIVAGMGGGAGTGIAPVIAACCAEEGVSFAATAVMPFSFEVRFSALEGYRRLHVVCKERLEQFSNDAGIAGSVTLDDAVAKANAMVCDSVQEVLGDIPGLVRRRTPPAGEACPLLSLGTPAAKS